MYQLLIHCIPPLSYAGGDIASVGNANAAINGELPNIAVTIDNPRGDYTAHLAAADVLRQRADLSQDGALIFSGAVQAIALGAAVQITLEA
jgi:hypothetical protein